MRTRIWPALAAAVVGISLAAAPASAAKKKKYPNVKGLWVGTFSYNDERPDGPARLQVYRQRGGSCSAYLTAGSYERVPVNGTLTRRGRITIRVNFNGVRGRVNGQLSRDRSQVEGTWSEVKQGMPTGGTFLLIRDR